MSFSAPDTAHMTHALALAREALFLTSPNPRVGCVIVSAQGEVLGSGHTQRAGEAHAEVMALRDAQNQQHGVRGATAYVTLEPCSHQGRTGPCCDALIHAGLSRVVVALQDPNPLVAGQGTERLRAAGVQVDVGLLSEEAQELNIGFFKRMTHGTPWVRMKVAASLDGQTALDNGVSQWITSAAARDDGHAWRARACAVLTGIGTVLEDDPQLNVRGLDTPRQPHLVVVDSRLDMPLNAQLLDTQGAGDQARQIWVYTAVDPAHAEQADKRAALIARGVTVVDMPGPGGKVDLAGMLRDLARREINELHVEAGHKLNGSFIREGLVDEYLVYLAPQLIGPGQGMAHLPVLSTLSDTLKLRFHSVDPIGPDLRLLLRRA